MTVQQLISELQKWPSDMPVAIMYGINPSDIMNPHHIELKQCTWIDGNYPYNKPDFEYLNLE